MPWVGAVGSVVSAGIGAVSSSSASDSASKSAKAAADLQAQQQAQSRADLAPFRDVGASAANQLGTLNTDGFTAGQPNYLQLSQDALPGQMTQAQLEATPGYQFNLAQGLQATQNSAAARGLGVSGAAMKGAATYATGLADSTYQNQFANAQTRSQDYLNLNTAQQGNAQNLYGRLSGTATIGENAASQTAVTGQASANNSGNYLNQSGQATAAGTLGVGNAVTGSIDSGVKNYLNYQGLQAGLSGGGTGGYSSAKSANSNMFSGSYGYTGS